MQHQKHDRCSIHQSKQHVYAHDFDFDDSYGNDLSHDVIDSHNKDMDNFSDINDYDGKIHNIDTPVCELNPTWYLENNTQLPKVSYQQLNVHGKYTWLALTSTFKRQFVKILPTS